MEIVYGPALNTAESDNVLVPAMTSRVGTVLPITTVLDITVPCVQVVPFPAVTGVLPSSVSHITVVPELEFVQVTVIGEPELPEVGVHEGVLAAPLPPIVKAPTVRELGTVAPDAVQLSPAIVYNV